MILVVVYLWHCVVVYLWHCVVVNIIGIYSWQFMTFIQVTAFQATKVMTAEFQMSAKMAGMSTTETGVSTTAEVPISTTAEMVHN